MVIAPGIGIGMVAATLLSETTMPGKEVGSCMVWGRACRRGLAIDSSDSAEDEDEGLTGRAYAQWWHKALVQLEHVICCTQASQRSGIAISQLSQTIPAPWDSSNRRRWACSCGDSRVNCGVAGLLGPASCSTLHRLSNGTQNFSFPLLRISLRLGHLNFGVGHKPKSTHIPNLSANVVRYLLGSSPSAGFRSMRNGLRRTPRAL